MPAPEASDTDRMGRLETPGERLAAYAATLRRRWRLALGIVAACVTAGLAAGALSEKSYEATAEVLIGQRAQIDALLGTSDYNPDPERDVNTSVKMITLEPVARRVRRRLDLDVPASALVDKVGVAVDSNSNVVSISARDSSPQRAARIANAFARAYRDFRARSAQANIDEAVASAEERLARLEPGSRRAALDAQLRRLQAAASFQTGGVQIVRRAAPASAVASRPLLSTGILAGLLGLVVAGVAIVVLARTDRRLRSDEELERVVGKPVLATVPIASGSGPSVAEHDALATLALSPAFRGAGRQPRVVLLSSPGPAEGTTDVTLGLACALGAMNLRVIAIEADLRDPSFARELGLQGGGGLTEVLQGTRALNEVLVQLESPACRSGRAWALPAGSAWSLPQPLLAGQEMAALIARARRSADVVLVAGAPAGSFGDSLALVPLTDATVLVVRLDVTARDDAERVVRAVEELDGNVVGAVATTGAAPGRRPPDIGAAPSRVRARFAPLDPAEVDRPTSNGAAEAAGATREGAPR